MTDHALAMLQLGIVAIIVLAIVWRRGVLPWLKGWIREVVREGNESEHRHKGAH